MNSLGKLAKIDEEERSVTIQFKKEIEIPSIVSVSVGGPINTDAINDALFRLVDGYLEGTGKFTAAIDFLRKAPPRIKGHVPGSPLIDETREALPQIIDRVVNMDNSTLFIQGPPGSGKTYTGSHLIAALLARGKRVGVSSNSHKAIHNLLHAVEERATERGLEFNGAYKASMIRGSEYEGQQITCQKTNEDIIANIHDYYQLAAGTAWLFSHPGMEEALDYLFVDEAGQVATANLVAMTTSARNIVLLGDQMQLGQPIQGDHPGESGLSSLDFLLEGMATIPQDKGIFLDT